MNGNCETHIRAAISRNENFAQRKTTNFAPLSDTRSFQRWTATGDPWLPKIVCQQRERWNLKRGSLKRGDIPLSTRGKLLDIQRPLDRSPLGLDLLLEKIDSINQLLGPRWTARNVVIDGNYLVNALHQCVIVEHTS